MIDSARDAFNEVADTIERIAEQNPINSWMRKASRQAFLATFPAGSTLVEIGCGAGSDAVFLGERGYRVAALDVSDRMVELTRGRVAALDLERTIVVWRGPIHDVASELMKSPWCPFDGAYANFSLGYEESLRRLAATVHGLIKPGAWFVFTIPNKLCLSEAAIAVGSLRFRKILGRFREPHWTTLRGIKVCVHLYTPAHIRTILRGLFEIEAIAGVPVFMPPPSFYRPAFERLRASLERLDNRFASSFPWRSFGETTLFKVRKVGT